jgi:hypothetical protein
MEPIQRHDETHRWSFRQFLVRSSLAITTATIIYFVLWFVLNWSFNIGAVYGFALVLPVVVIPLVYVGILSDDNFDTESHKTDQQRSKKSIDILLMIVTGAFPWYVITFLISYFGIMEIGALLLGSIGVLAAAFTEIAVFVRRNSEYYTTHD